jgi:hypothetical protein
MGGRSHTRQASAVATPALSAIAILSALALCAPVLAQGGPPLLVTAVVAPDTATIGDQLHYVLTVDRAESVTVVPPALPEALAPFEVLAASPMPPERRDGRVVEKSDLTIAAFETGELWVPALEFGYVTARGDSGATFTDSLAVTVRSVLPKAGEDQQIEPEDIKAPIDLPRNWWPLIVGVLVLAALGVAGYFLRRWLMARAASEVEKATREEPRVPRTAAHVVALKRLGELERDDLIGRGEIAAFYVRVTEIVRFYLRDRFGVDAIDMTTTELPGAMRTARMDESEIRWSEDYLAHADLAKFAKHVPAEERARGDLAEARDFVERTRLRGGAPGAGEPADRPGGTGARAAGGTPGDADGGTGARADGGDGEVSP